MDDKVLRSMSSTYSVACWWIGGGLHSLSSAAAGGANFGGKIWVPLSAQILIDSYMKSPQVDNVPVPKCGVGIKIQNADD